MRSNLLTSLRKYRPRENSDPLENFITESFAWLLNNYPPFGRFFLMKVLDRLEWTFDDVPESLDWVTQANFSGVYPDMICRAGDSIIIFEHKAWSHLHGNQLNNYREYASKKFGVEKYKIVLITGGKFQHDQNPDIALCWHNIFHWVGEWQKENQTDFIFDDFKELLSREGMGPQSLISHEAILSYFSARDFPRHLSQFIERAEKDIKWKSLVEADHFKISVVNKRGSLYGDAWGRIGIKILDGLIPGLFVGFMLDGRDHRVAPLNSQSPDCSVIFDFSSKYHDIYPTHNLYLSMVKEISEGISSLDWDFHNHLAEHENPNKHHPIHIRIPIVDLFRETRTSEEQLERFKCEVTKVLGVISSCDNFWKLRDLLGCDDTI